MWGAQLLTSSRAWSQGESVLVLKEPQSDGEMQSLSLQSPRSDEGDMTPTLGVPSLVDKVLPLGTS